MCVCVVLFFYVCLLFGRRTNQRTPPWAVKREREREQTSSLGDLMVLFCVLRALDQLEGALPCIPRRCRSCCVTLGGSSGGTTGKITFETKDSRYRLYVHIVSF